MHYMYLRNLKHLLRDKKSNLYTSEYELYGVVKELLGSNKGHSRFDEESEKILELKAIVVIR